jgi:hypothetical protein
MAALFEAQALRSAGARARAVEGFENQEKAREVYVGSVLIPALNHPTFPSAMMTTSFFLLLLSRQLITSKGEKLKATRISSVFSQ